MPATGTFFKPASVNILLHSDDLGATESVSQGILDRWRNGYLDGFSVMANGEAGQTCQTALRAEAGRPARIVVHLNLSEGPSTLPASEIPLLVNTQGKLQHGYGSLLKLWYFGGKTQRDELLRQVAAEWQAQIERVRNIVAPRPLTAVDGHVHIHMLPFLFPVAAQLARENGIPAIRISQEPFYFAGWRDLFSSAFGINLLKHLILRVYARSARPAAQKNGLTHPERIIGLLYSGRMSQQAVLAGIHAAQSLGTQSLEVVMHVGRADKRECSRWTNQPSYAAFNLSPLRDLEFREVALLHEELFKRGLRAKP